MTLEVSGNEYLKSDRENCLFSISTEMLNRVGSIICRQKQFLRVNREAFILLYEF